ncbi:MAG: hypothetical protein ACFFDK_05220 [Promethearchaeota archaeon]
MSVLKKSKILLSDCMKSFESLKKVILTELNDTVRYEATKVLYEKFPEESLSFIKDVLIRDFNYNFRIFEFSEGRRYNVNDLLNSMIIRSHDKAQMANDIINNNLIQFALSWKDFTRAFNIFYDLHLGAFILFHNHTEIVAYLCTRACDPFHFIHKFKDISFSKSLHLTGVSKKAIRSMVKLLKDLLSIHKRDLILSVLYTQTENTLPKYKLSSKDHDVILYFGGLDK